MFNNSNYFSLPRSNFQTIITSIANVIGPVILRKLHDSAEAERTQRLHPRRRGWGDLRARNGNYFVPMSYPEGCPLHPSYPLDGRCFRMRILWVIIANLVAAIALAEPVGAEQNPIDVIKALVNPALQIMADKTAPLKDRQQKLRDLVNSNFDFLRCRAPRSGATGGISRISSATISR